MHETLFRQTQNEKDGQKVMKNKQYSLGKVFFSIFKNQLKIWVFFLNFLRSNIRNFLEPVEFLKNESLSSSKNQVAL